MSTFYFEKLKRLHALAEIGLEFSEIAYDQERYQEMRDISLEMLEKMTSVPVEQIIPVLEEKNGYRTPKVDIRAAVFNENNQILLIQEKADQLWAMPGGWTDISYSPAEVAEKECMEEAGISVKAVKLLGILDKQKQKMPPAFEYVYKIFMLCEKQDNHISTGSETMDVGWFSEDTIPELSTPRNTHEQIKLMFACHRKEVTQPFFD